MKKVLITFFTLAAAFSLYGQSSSAPRQSDLDDNFILYSLIAKRCERYMPVNNLADCRDSVSSMVKVLDPHLMFPDTNSFLFIAFKKNLIEVLSKENTEIYLNNLQNEMNRFLVGENQNFNLWDFTLKHYTLPEVAAQMIATLFQDTTHAKLHLVYLDKADIRGGPVFIRNKELLSLTIDTMNSLFDYSSTNAQFFPRTIKANLNRGLYHFYVPLHLSLQLKATGTKKLMAFVAPFLMTLTYEFITTTPDYRYVLRDPAALDPKKHEWKIRDIFAGYLGASMGTDKKITKEFKFLSESFSISTKKTVNALLFHKK